MCEMGVLYGWKYMLTHIIDEAREKWYNAHPNRYYAPNYQEMTDADKIEFFDYFYEIMNQQWHKQNYAHYFDIRTNHLNEKDWRRSFSINQMLYGMILYATADHQLHNSFDEILPLLKEQYGENKNE